MASKDRDTGYSYIGRRPCGCVVSARVDTQDRDTAKSVAEMIRNGETVERVTHDYVREHLWKWCPDCQRKRDEKRARTKPLIRD